MLLYVRSRCHIKMFPSWKIRPGKNNHGFDVSPLLKYRHRSRKKSTHYRIALPQKVSPADNLPVKIHGQIFAGKLLAGETFLGERFYDGTPAERRQVGERRPVDAKSASSCCRHWLADQRHGEEGEGLGRPSRSAEVSATARRGEQSVFWSSCAVGRRLVRVSLL